MSRSQARFTALGWAASRDVRKFSRTTSSDSPSAKVSDYFGCNTFSFDLMEKKLPSGDVAILREYATANRGLTLELADKVAAAVKEWAMLRGATHYCHWFQPQTGLTAEKHDAFFHLDPRRGAVEKFTGKQLIQSEPDASSFPSGGVRSTFEARGYTVWDASSPMFLMETTNGKTLCIPSLFISYSGAALDLKTPLLRSLHALNEQATAALKLLGHETGHVVATAGPEQEFFVVDEALFALRPDLLLAGRTLLGKAPPRHQQLEDHYFGSIRPRVLNFFLECEHELYKLGVPCKTRHNEVAPSQCEMAPIFEQANVAADHNQLVMEVVKSVAERHQLTALFHEKPYAEVNGSGKHVNWSLADAQGHNLLEPGDQPLDNLRFLYFLAATVKAIHEHGALLRIASATPGNDFRLGANEAPPAIISVFLGDTLSEVVSRIVSGSPQAMASRDNRIDLDLARVPVIERDNTDRNRTSPFAFTGNKFEFRAVGASASISPALTNLNAAVANAISQMNAKLRSLGGEKPSSVQILEVVKATLQKAQPVCFEGNNYSPDWHREAEQRGLPNLRTCMDAFQAMTDSKVIEPLVTMKVLGADETAARFNVQRERYIKTRVIELETLRELIRTHVFPAAVASQSRLADAVSRLNDALGKPPKHQQQSLAKLNEVVEDLLTTDTELDVLILDCKQHHDEDLIGRRLAGDAMALMDRARHLCNQIEGLVDDCDWSLPKFRELLYVY